jgi:hypothetical protein
VAELRKGVASGVDFSGPSIPPHVPLKIVPPQPPGGSSRRIDEAALIRGDNGEWSRPIVPLSSSISLATLFAAGTGTSSMGSVTRGPRTPHKRAASPYWWRSHSTTASSENAENVVAAKQASCHESRICGGALALKVK